MPKDMTKGEQAPIKALEQLSANIFAPSDFKDRVLARAKEEQWDMAPSPWTPLAWAWKVGVLVCLLLCFASGWLGSYLAWQPKAEAAVLRQASGWHLLAFIEAQLAALMPSGVSLSYEETRKVGAEYIAQGQYQEALKLYKQFLLYANKEKEVAIRREMASLYYAMYQHKKVILVVSPALAIAPDLTLLRYRIAACDALGECESTLTKALEAAARLGDEDAGRRLSARQGQGQPERQWQPRSILTPLI